MNMNGNVVDGDVVGGRQLRQRSHQMVQAPLSSRTNGQRVGATVVSLSQMAVTELMEEAGADGKGSPSI